MSRIGNKLITIPEGLEVSVENGVVTIKGKNGTDTVKFPTDKINVEVEDKTVKVTRLNEEKHTKQLHGTIRALINNACVGCHDGYKKVLEIRGIGYRADMKGKDLVLALGYSHPITIHPVDGVELKVTETKNKDVNFLIEVTGQDKFKVGQVAALIREQRRPEPYKGKGVRYQGENVLRKEGKRAGK